jgi:DNA-binding Xre family transcriptional regulator
MKQPTNTPLQKWIVAQKTNIRALSQEVELSTRTVQRAASGKFATLKTLKILSRKTGISPQALANTITKL